MNNELKRILQFLFLSLWCFPELSYAQFGSQQIISIDCNFPIDGDLADIDGDGDNDIVVISYSIGEISWFANLDGLGTFGAKQVIHHYGLHGSAIDIVDLDGDGDLDVIGVYPFDGVVFWFENEDGQGSFGESIEVGFSDTPRDAKGVDIDNDGDMDILVVASIDNEIIFYENVDGQGYNFNEIVIVSDPLLEGSSKINLADFDGDNDLDIAFTTYLSDVIGWIENTDGVGTFGNVQVLATEIEVGNDINSADLDGDGDMDIVASPGGDNKIIWFENLDGQGGFSSSIPLEVSTNGFLNGVDVGDLDLDGDLDLIYSAYEGGLYSFENLDGMGDFSASSLISFDIPGSINGRLFDIDEDGDLDLFSASLTGINLAWYENLLLETLNFTIDVNPILCFGEKTGAINVNVIGGQVPYTYSWFPSNISGSNPTGVPAGVYDLTITDGIGNTLTTTIEVNQPEEGLVGITSSTPEIDSGGDGTAFVMATGGTSPYFFLWNTNPPETTESVVGLIADTYLVTITDANGCTTEESVLIDMINSTYEMSQLQVFNIAPNPSFTNARISIQFLDSPIWSLAIKNVLGQTINTFNGQGDWTKELEVSSFSVGTYWVTLYLENQESITKKLLVF